MEHATCGARSSRARSVWLRVVLALGLLFGMGNAAAQCALEGTVGVPYSQSFSVSGGSAPYSWSISAGALPPGVALQPSSTATAWISGTATAGGTFNFTIRVSHSGGSGTLACSLTMATPTFVVTPDSLPDGHWNVPYSQSFAASGGTAPYTFSVSWGALPAGVTVLPDGTLSGTPTVAGTFNFTLGATDSSTGTGPYSTYKAYTLVVAPPTITLAPASLPDATVASAYAQSITASGGTGPYFHAVTAGALPAGLALSASGTLEGTPTEGGSFAFSVTATDANGFTGVQDYTLGVNPPAMSLAPATLPNAVAGAAYSQSIIASGGVEPYGYAVASGTLPAGFSLSSTGVLSGTTTAAGSFDFTVVATDSATGSGPYTVATTYTLLVDAPTITIAPPALPAGTAGVAYSQALSASGGVGPHGFSLVGGALPAGLSFSSAGVLSGTPTVAGDFSFTVRATDANGFTGDQAYTLSLAAPTIVVAPPTLPGAIAGTAYSQALDASGGVGPYGYSLVGGALPAGLSFSSAGVLSGTPTVAGDFGFTVRATDANGFSADQAYTLGIAAPAIAVTPATLAPGIAGTAYSQALDASGGVAPYGYSLASGALPAGLSLSAAGALSGTPTVAGDFDFTVRATDANGFAGEQAYTLTVVAPAIAVTPATLPAGTAGTPYSQALSASGGVEPYAWSLAGGSLPAGLALSAGGTLAGTPTVAGSFDFTVRATDANGFSGEQAYTLAIVAPAIAVTPATLSSGTGGTAYSQAFEASGGVAPYGYSLASGALPAGLSLSAAGTLSGTPTVAGDFDFTVRATDANGFTGEQAYTLSIAAPAIALTPATLPAGTAATAYSQALSASGGAGPYAYALSAGELPPGIELSPAGVVAGTPTAVGRFEFTVTATDANGFTGEQAYALDIAALVPVAHADSAHTAAVQSVTVDVTANDTGGPFTAATVLSVSPVDAGTATISQSGGAWLLTFVPAAHFSGTATVRYTVSNAYATSAAATLEILVEARPDPSRDPDVLGLLSAQAEATRGFARAQIGNVQQRMESLHGGANGNGWQNRLGPASGTRCDPGRVHAGEATIGEELDPATVACGSMQGAGAASATAAPAQASSAPVGLWTAGAFGSGERDQHFGRSALDFETRGLSLGADYRLSDALVFGAALGYGRDRTNVGMHETRADGDAWTAMAYASWSPSGATFLDAVFGYQRLSFDTLRTVAANGATVAGRRDGTQWFGSLATGYEYRNDGVVIAPYARVDVARAELDGYAEQGDPVHALRYGRQDVDTGTASLGLRLERRFQQEWGVFAPLFRLEHQRDFQGQGSATLQYADLPSGPFYRAYGDTFDRSRWLLGLGTAFTLSEALGLKLEYQFMGDDTMDDQTLRLILQGSF
jgi:uncharacterized protein with beta-barrel porin domain